MSTVVVDDHLLRDVLTGERTADLGGVATALATTGLGSSDSAAHGLRRARSASSLLLLLRFLSTNKNDSWSS